MCVSLKLTVTVVCFFKRKESGVNITALSSYDFSEITSCSTLANINTKRI